MIFNEVALARTYQGKLELVTVEYETIGLITKPTKRADRFLEKYKSWRNLSYILQYNPAIQAELENTFGYIVK